MISISLKQTQKISKLVKNLYQEAFPVSEQLPILIFKKWLKNNIFTLWEFYDQDVFIGFAYLGVFDNFCYIDFLAVVPNLRSRGYGSKILENLKKYYKDKILIVAVEQPDGSSQKDRRVAFYQKNNFVMNGFKINLKYGGDFLVMSTKKVNLEYANQSITQKMSKFVKLF